jgi:signal peptidase I
VDEIPDPQNKVPSAEDQPPRKSSLRLLATLCSLLIPGLGQLLLGNKRCGTMFLVAFFGLGLLYWPLRLPTLYSGFMTLVLLHVGLTGASGWQALRSFSLRAAAVSRFWLLLVVPLTLVFSLSIEMNLGLRCAGFRVFSIPSSSMATTLDSGDVIVADTRYFRNHDSHDGEVVIFRHKGIVFVKRIIASSGEQVSSEDGNVSVNGRPIAEPYVEHTGNAMPEMNTFGPITVPANELFVMGDNRDVSLDSRLPDQFGTVQKDDLVGVPLYIFTSKRMGRKVE